MKIKTLSKNNCTIKFSNLVLIGLLTFLLCLFWPNQIKAQTPSYQPFPTNYGLWHYAGYNDFGNYTGQQYDLLLQGDTLIDTVQYSKIYHNGISYNGAIREEAKKVYYRAKNASQKGYCMILILA